MHEMRIDAKIENLEKVLGFVEEAMEPYKCSTRTSSALAVAVEEIFVNIAHYAYPTGEGTGWAEISTAVGENAEGTPEISITFVDGGIPYDPLAKEDPDVTLSAEERQIGGLGIYMVKKSMDRCSYERSDDKNHFTMVKKLV